jgi:hypothetical protein
MKVACVVPAIEATHDGAGVGIEGDVVYLEPCLFSHFAKKPEAVLDVLDDVKHQCKVKPAVIGKSVAEDKLTARTAVLSAQLVRLRADVITGELDIVRQHAL